MGTTITAEATGPPMSMIMAGMIGTMIMAITNSTKGVRDKWGFRAKAGEVGEVE